MRKFRFLTILTLLLAFLVVSASAQRTRRPARKPAPKPTPTPVRTPVATAEVSAAKLKVSNQLHNVNVFVERMGPIAVAIENADKDAAARRLKQSEVEANNKNKQRMVQAIQVMRATLVDLETEFRAKPGLAAYLPKIQGISGLGSQSEDHAIAGKFVAAKDPLRQAALKLNETLLVMPGPPAGGGTSRPVANTPVRTVPVSSTQASPPSNTTSPATGREPAVGMTTAQVLQSSWGTPADKRNSKTANGTTEVWTYTGKGTIYFFNGKVTQIVR